MKIIIEADPGEAGKAMADFIRTNIAKAGVVPVQAIQVVCPSTVTISNQTSSPFELSIKDKAAETIKKDAAGNGSIAKLGLEVDADAAIISMEKFTKAANDAAEAAKKIQRILGPRPFYS